MKTFFRVITSYLLQITTLINGNIYELNAGPANWYEAMKTCAKNGSSLVTIDSLSTIAELNLQRLNITDSRFWTGLSRLKNTTWLWVNDYGLGWSNWYTDELVKTGDCMQATWTSGHWWFVSSCWERRPFLCEYTTNITTCTYQLTKHALIIGHTKLTSWGDKIDECEYLCDTVTTFACGSFHHSAVYNLCYYNDVNRWNTPEAFAENINWDYYHKTCSVGRLGDLKVEVSIYPSATYDRYTTVHGMRTMVCTRYTGESETTQPIPTQPISTQPITPEDTTPRNPATSQKTPIKSNTTTDVTSKIVTHPIVGSVATNSRGISVSPSNTAVSEVSTSVLSSATTGQPGTLPGERPSIGAVSADAAAILKKLKENALRKKKISAYDGRVSSTIIGSLAVVILLGLVVLVIIADDGAVTRDCRMKAVANIRSRNESGEKITLKFKDESKVKDSDGSYGSDSVLMNNLDTSLSISDNMHERGVLNFLSESNVHSDNFNTFMSTTNVNNTDMRNDTLSRNSSSVFLVQEAHVSRRPKTAKPGSRNSRVHPAESFVRSEVASRCSLADEGLFREVEMTMNSNDTDFVDFPPLS